MNAFDLAQKAYSPRHNATRTPRSTEHAAFTRVTRKLKSALENGAHYTDLVEALYENRRIWTMLAGAVAEDDNGLPAELRARIFYLYRFTDQHTRKVMNREVSADILVDINTAVMHGLRGEDTSG